MHGRHFTFKSILSNTAITIVAPSVTGTLVTQERPYVVQGPWLQVLLPPALTDRMAYELRVLNSNDYVSRSFFSSFPYGFRQLKCQIFFLRRNMLRIFLPGI